jgi:hypothetical protein
MRAGDLREACSEHTTAKIVTGEDGGSDLGIALSEIEEDALEAEINSRELSIQPVRQFCGMYGGRDTGRNDRASGAIDTAKIGMRKNHSRIELHR